MTASEIRDIKSLIIEREEIALKRLEGNLLYQNICHRQEESGKNVEVMLQERFTHEERITIRRHYEGENEKLNH